MTTLPAPHTFTPLQRALLAIGAALCILTLFVAPLKFGVSTADPAEKKVLTAPQDTLDWVLNTYPAAYAVPPMVAVACVCIAAMVLGLVPVRKSRSALVAGCGWVALIMGMAIADKSLAVREWANNPVKVQFALYGTFYLACALFIARPKYREAATVILLTSGVYVCVTAFFQYCGGLEDLRQAYAKREGFESFAMYTNHVFSSPHDYNEMLAVKKLSSNRVSGTFVYPNALGGFLLVLTPLCVGFFASMRTRLARTLSCMALVAAMAALLLSRSKSCIALAGVGIAFLAFLAFRARQLSRPFLLAISIMAMVAVAGMLAWGYRDDLGKRIKATGSARLDYWRTAATMIAKEPLRGWGSGAYGRNYLIYAPKGAEPTKLAHNAPLNLWVDYGFLGFAGCLMALGIPAIAGLYRASRKGQFDWLAASSAVAGACFFLHTLVDFDFHIVGIMLPGMFALAMGQMGGVARSASETGVQ